MKAPVVLLLGFLTTSAYAVQTSQSGKIFQPQFDQAPHCKERPDFLNEKRSELMEASLQSLPHAILVARDVEYYIDGKQDDQNVSVYGYQSFLKEENKSKILCGQSPDGFNRRFLISAPTIIDTSKGTETTQSFWHFQLMVNRQKYSFWNFKSPSFSKSLSLQDWLKKADGVYKIYQRSHSEYEILMVKKDGNLNQYFSIRYDVVMK